MCMRYLTRLCAGSAARVEIAFIWLEVSVNGVWSPPYNTRALGSVNRRLDLPTAGLPLPRLPHALGTIRRRQMRERSPASVSALSAALAIGALVTVPLAGQTQSTTAKSQTSAKTKAWTLPRTPWGDPDLQGNYTNVYENGTPLERPDQFAGRKLDEVKGGELTTIKKETQRRTIANFEGPIHAPDHWWQDALFLEKGSQAWLITEPSDGRIPPMTADAQRRIDAARTARAASGRGPADSYEDRSLYDRCITRGYPK